MLNFPCARPELVEGFLRALKDILRQAQDERGTKKTKRKEMNKKHIFSTAILLIIHGTVFTMMHTRKIMNGTSRLTLHKHSYCGGPLNYNFSKMSAAEEQKALEKLEIRDKHYAWQIANEVAKIKVKCEILAANLSHVQEQRMLQEADKIVIKKE